MIEVQNNSGTGASPDDLQPFKVYKPCSISVPIPTVPDDYYNPTMADLKDAQATLIARTRALVNAPLQTRAMRESVEKARKDRWPVTTIRVRFPDRTQLEKVFPSSDKIKSIYAFVRHCLNDEAKAVKFILYQAPPKRDLRVSDPKIRGLSLADLQLAPSSILLLRFESENLNSTLITPPLNPSILSQAIDMPLPLTSAAPTRPTDSLDRTSSEADKSKGKGLPKWVSFKLGAKK